MPTICADEIAGTRMTALRAIEEKDLAGALAIINEAAEADRGVLPADRWPERFMARAELETEIAAGVAFWVAEEHGRLLGVIGLQDKQDVVLVRHAYVARGTQRTGLGTRLLRHVSELTNKPILIGTWAAA